MYLSVFITLLGSWKEADKFFILFFTCPHKEIYGTPLVCILKIQKILLSLTEISIEPLHANSRIGNNKFFSGANQIEISKHGLIVIAQILVVLIHI